MAPSQTFVTRALSKGFIPTLNTSSRHHPPPATGNGALNMASVHAISRHSSRTPPPAPRLKTIPLPRLESRNAAPRDTLKVSLLPSVHAPQREHTALNSLLAHGKKCRLILFDVTGPPPSLHAPYRPSESATYPTSASMNITCDGLPWSIDIFAGEGGILTCLDVLNGIYASLQRPVSSLEWAVTPIETKTPVLDAFLRRCQAEYSKKEPRLRRLDFLLGTTRFRGLSSLGYSGKWLMHLDVRL